MIRCPPDLQNSRATLSVIARNGVELKVSARVTVRTNLNQLIGGATEETIIARVGQGIITAIGLADNHMDVLAKPSQIAKNVLERGLDASTAFEIFPTTSQTSKSVRILERGCRSTKQTQIPALLKRMPRGVVPKLLQKRKS